MRVNILISSNSDDIPVVHWVFLALSVIKKKEIQWKIGPAFGDSFQFLFLITADI